MREFFAINEELLDAVEAAEREGTGNVVANLLGAEEGFALESHLQAPNLADKSRGSTRPDFVPQLSFASLSQAPVSVMVPDPGPDKPLTPHVGDLPQVPGQDVVASLAQHLYDQVASARPPPVEESGEWMVLDGEGEFEGGVLREADGGVSPPDSPLDTRKPEEHRYAAVSAEPEYFPEEAAADEERLPTRVMKATVEDSIRGQDGFIQPAGSNTARSLPWENNGSDTKRSIDPFNVIPPLR